MARNASFSRVNQNSRALVAAGLIACHRQRAWYEPIQWRISSMRSVQKTGVDNVNNVDWDHKIKKLRYLYFTPNSSNLNTYSTNSIQSKKSNFK